MVWWILGCQGCYGLSIRRGVLIVAPTLPGGRRGSGVCVAGLGLVGKWCPHQRKRRKQLEEEEPKRGSCQRATPAMC